MRDEEQAADERRRNATAGLTEQRRAFGEEVPAQGVHAAGEHRPDEDPEHEDRRERGAESDELGDAVGQQAPPTAAGARSEMFAASKLIA